MASRRRRLRAGLKLRRWFRKQDRFTRVLLVAVSTLGLFVAWLFFVATPPEHPRPANETAGTPSRAIRPRPGFAPRPSRSSHAAIRAAAPERAKPAVAARRSADRPRVALVIDDLGQNLEPLQQLAELGLPLSVAVLPHLEHTAQTVRTAERLNFEILLHLPLEPLDAKEKNPGQGALLTTMSAEEMRALLRDDLASVPGAVGVNNHMGSRFTVDLQALGILMTELKERGLFWLDSRTTPLSLAYAVAREHGLAAADRDVFLDTQDDPVIIRGQVLKLIETAKRNGSAVGIGHPHQGTLAVLLAMREELRSSGVHWVQVSSLVRSAAVPGVAAQVSAGSSAGGVTAAVTRGKSSLVP